MSLIEDRRRSMNCAKISGFMFRQVRAFAIDQLAGVGVGKAKFEQGTIAFHLRKRLSDEEILSLPPSWCALTPFDDGGDMKLIEWI
jgi:hypothetical protein